MRGDLLKFLVANLLFISLTYSSQREFLIDKNISRSSNFSWKIPSFTLDEFHTSMSKGAWWVSNTVDSIFSDNEISTKPNRGFFQLSVESIYNQGEVEIRPRFRLKIRMDRTKKLLKIHFSSDDDQVRSLPPPEKSTPTAGIEANVGFFHKVKVSTSTGLRISTPAHWYWLLRSRYDSDEFDLGFNVRYTTHNKWILQQYYQHIFSHLILNSDFFWSESSGVTFSQRIGVKAPRYPVWFYLGINGTANEVFKNQQTRMELKYSNNLYQKKWLHYNIGLRNFYRRENNWKSDVETYVSIEGRFGGI